MKIAKNHEAYLKIKNALKKNNNKFQTVSDDLQVLKIAVDNNLEIDTLLYCYEIEYHEDTKLLLNELIEKAKESYEISLSSYNALALKENHHLSKFLFLFYLVLFPLIFLPKIIHINNFIICFIYSSCFLIAFTSRYITSVRYQIHFITVNSFSIITSK